MTSWIINDTRGTINIDDQMVGKPITSRIRGNWRSTITVNGQATMLGAVTVPSKSQLITVIVDSQLVHNDKSVLAVLFLMLF